MRHRFSSSLITITLVACGARTALLTTDNPDATIEDGGPDRRDASKDVRDEDAEDAPDDIPQIDTTKPDVPIPNDCPDADSTVVYLISQTNDLMSFYPPNLSFKTIGKINCPSMGTPFSMGVDRKAGAYIVFTTGELFKVSTLTAACSKTAFKPMPMNGFDTFGMGFSGDNNGELLYVAGSPVQQGVASAGLASIDTTQMSYPFKFINPFVPSLGRTELSGTGDGRLFGWSPNDTCCGSRLSQIDPTNAKIIGANNLKIGTPNDAFAFAFWGGDFWIFTSPGGPTTVTKYDPGSKLESTATTTSVTIVGAGVSTCAPQQ